MQENYRDSFLVWMIKTGLGFHYYFEISTRNLGPEYFKLGTPIIKYVHEKTEDNKNTKATDIF